MGEALFGFCFLLANDQFPTQRKIPATGPNPDWIHPLLQNPSLLSNIPLRHISSQKSKSDGLALTRRNLDLVEASKLSHRSAWNVNVQLGNLLRCNVACIGYHSASCCNNVPETLHTTFDYRRFGSVVGCAGILYKRYAEIGVLECSVGEAETEFVPGSDVSSVKVAIVNVYAFCE